MSPLRPHHADDRRARHDDPPRTLVVSPSFLLRSAYSMALEDEGHVVTEASTADEVLWCLVAARTGDGEPVDLIVADASTRGARELLGEVRASPSPPAMVMVGLDGAASEARTDLIVVPNARKLDDVLKAVERALTGRDDRQAEAPDERPLRLLVAVEDAGRRDALVAALARRGAGVVEVEDGLALLELLGRQLNQPGGWYPDVVVMDARLPRMDGLDALEEVRQCDRRLRAVVLAVGDDQDALERVRALAPAVAFDRDAPVDDVVDRVLRRRGATTRAVRSAPRR